MRCWIAVGVLLTGGLCAGCGGSGTSLVEVSGTVRFDEKPEADCTLTLLPMIDTSGTSVYGRTGPDGKFKLDTLHLGKGAPPGKYKVVISKWVQPDGSDFPPGTEVAPMDVNAKQKFPPQYSDPEQTTLTAEIKPGMQPLDFSLKSQPPQ